MSNRSKGYGFTVATVYALSGVSGVVLQRGKEGGKRFYKEKII